MDFKSFKEKVVNFKKNQVSNAGKRLLNSKLTISDKEALQKAIDKSENTSITVEKTGEVKVFKKHSIVIFLGKDPKAFEDYVGKMTILKTKAWSQNVFFALSSLESKDLKKYKISELPCLVLWTNKKIEKKVVGKENIKKIEKFFEFDIVKAIKEI